MEQALQWYSSVLGAAKHPLYPWNQAATTKHTYTPPTPFLFSPSPEMAISSKQLADAQGEEVDGEWMGVKNGNPDFLCFSALQEKAG